MRFFRLRLTGSDGTNTIQVPLIRVGGEGGLLNHAVEEGGVVAGFDFKYESGEVLLDPGDRVDVVAVFPPTATGVYTLWTKLPATRKWADTEYSNRASRTLQRR